MNRRITLLAIPGIVLVGLLVLAFVPSNINDFFSLAHNRVNQETWNIRVNAIIAMADMTWQLNRRSTGVEA